MYLQCIVLRSQHMYKNIRMFLIIQNNDVMFFTEYLFYEHFAHWSYRFLYCNGLTKTTEIEA